MSDRPESRAGSDLSVVDAWRLLARPPVGRRAGQFRPVRVKSYVGIGTIIGLLNLSAIAAIAGAAIPAPTIAALAVLIQMAVVPGLLLAFVLIPTDEVDLVEWLVLGLGLGVVTLIVGGLILTLLEVRLVPITVFGWSAVLSLVFSVFAFGRSLSWQAPSLGSRSDLAGAALVAACAALLRLPGLGYSEFQGDETEAILRATGVVQGLPDAVFYHGKGPGEVVVVAMLYGFLGMLNEGAARLPFALAGVSGTVAAYLVARQLLGAAGGLAVGLLLAVNGYFIAFSRITQYQSLVLFLGMLALWSAVRWSRGGSGVWPVLSGILAATAALAHYDALFILPPIALVILWRTGPRLLADRDQLMPWLKGALAGLVVLALFFVPYLDSPLFSLATGRIEDRVGAGFPHNNVPSIVASATLYLGTVFPILVGGLILLGQVGLLVRRPDSPPLRVWLLGLAWAAVPFLFYAFVARKPGTHIHVATPGLLLLAGAGFAAAWAAFGRPLTPNPSPYHGRGGTSVWYAPSPAAGRGGWGVRAPRAVLGAVFAVGIAGVATYVVPVYLQTTAEVVRENRVGGLPFAWRPPGGLPAKERFGFPYQAGWKTIGALYADGTLNGSFDTNEQPQVSHWYTRGAWRCSANPRYYLIGENVQDEIETPSRTISNEYHQIGTISVAGEAKLRVYERGPANGSRPPTWPAETLAPTFDRQVSAPTLDPGPWARGVLSREATLHPIEFGEDVQLLGYQVYAEDPHPGGVVRVDLFWLPHVDSDEQHRIDVQLGRESRIGDGGGPACDKTGEEKEWTAGRPFTQRVSIPIAAGAAPGQYPLLVSVSTLDGPGGPLLPSSGTTATDALVEIGQIEVQSGGDPAR